MIVKIALGAEIDIPQKGDIREAVGEELGSFFAPTDYSTRGLRRPEQIALDSNGDGSVDITNVNSDALWRVHRVSAILSAAGSTPIVQVKIGVDYLCTITATGVVGNTYEFQSPVYVRRGESVTIVVDSGPASGTAYVTVWYDEVLGGNR